MSSWLLTFVAGCGIQQQADRPVADVEIEDTSPPPAPAPTTPFVPRVVLNEWMASNGSVHQLPDGSLPDWFELYNADSTEVDLGRVSVSDASGGKWTGPAGAILPPGAHYLVVADDSDVDGHAPFALSADDDELELSIDDQRADAVAISSFPTDVSSARTPDGGAWTSTIWATPGEPNPSEASPTLDPADALFGDGHVSEFAITVDPSYEDELDVQFGDGVPGTVTFQGVTLDVSVKLKGSGSFQPLAGKPAWKIDVNELVPGQRLRGLKGITLNNGDHDPTFVRESISYAMFGAIGLPEKRVGWAKVTYNGLDYGLYVHVETTDDLFLERWFADPTGMLLEGTKTGDLREWDLLELEEGILDTVFLEDLAVVLSDPAAVGALEQLEAMVDLDAFLTYAAGEAMSLHWDGYQKPKNYHLYLDPTTARLRWLPHGTDWTFLLTESIWYGNGDVFEFCLLLPECTARYEAALISVVDTFDTLDAATTFQARYDWLEPEILADPRIIDTDEFREAQFAETLSILNSRTADIRAELGL